MKGTKSGDSIKGNIVLASAAKISHMKLKHGSSTHKIQQHTLSGYAYCVIERPMIKRPGKTTYPEDVSTPLLLDELEGENIATQSRKFLKQGIVPSNKHGQLYQAKLSGNVYCVIQKPMRSTN